MSTQVNRDKTFSDQRDSILASTGKIPQLKAHIRMGLINGLTEVEIRECLLHIMGYCGFPAGLDA